MAAATKSIWPLFAGFMVVGSVFTYVNVQSGVSRMDAARGRLYEKKNAREEELRKKGVEVVPFKPAA